MQFYFSKSQHWNGNGEHYIYISIFIVTLYILYIERHREKCSIEVFKPKYGDEEDFMKDKCFKNAWIRALKIIIII